MIFRILSKITNFIVLFTSLFFSVIYAQTSDKEIYEEYYKKSIDLNKISLFSESIKELNIAIRIAKESNLEKQYFEASVFLGELMRRTTDNKKGIEILENLIVPEKYLKIKVKKLGRMAALYAEGGKYPGRSPKDSIQKYLKIALKIAENNNFESEEAALCNELGFNMIHSRKFKVINKYFERSALLYKKLKDDNNYVNVMSHLLHIKLVQEKFEEADQLIIELLKLTKNKKWYGTKQTLYRTIGNRYLTVGDTINYYKWHIREKDAAGNSLESRSNNEMSYYRVKYDTEKLKNQVTKTTLESEEKTVILKQQKRINNILLVFIIVFLVLTVVVVMLFKKKNKLAKNLKISNDKFQMLMVESNHRIKNNLQMILSMVDYSNDNASKTEKQTLDKISGKIQTIGVLHKHLYTNVHKESVNISLYFNEIIRLYSKMNPKTLEVTPDVFSIEINSERIVYFGLILNELLANTIEHNLSEVKKVTINIKQEENHYVFEYCDYSPHKDIYTEGKGSILLNQLINRVKGTNYQLDKKTGAHKFEFKDVI
jgi:two-component sensor histidine kinase